jgi:YoeB-like toxin of bacterial type II toxin-antitoxin system
VKIVFLSQGWEDYLFWQEQDPKVAARVNELMRDAVRSPLNVDITTNSVTMHIIEDDLAGPEICVLFKTHFAGMLANSPFLLTEKITLQSRHPTMPIVLPRLLR